MPDHLGNWVLIGLEKGITMSLRDKLKRLKDDEAASCIDWEMKKNNWINSVRQLYDTIMNWFADLEKGGFVRFAQIEDEHSEEHIGPYKINLLTMDFSKRKLVLQPVGTNIIGAHGRVDMFPQGFRDQGVMLILFRAHTEPKERWEIWLDKSSKNAKSLTKENLESLIEGWL